MVTCHLRGGLGNQMFMIAATIGYAIKHGLPYHIPPHTIHPPLWPSYFVKLQNKSYNKRLPIVTIQEKEHCYQKLPFETSWKRKNIVLDGYWQSEKYFKHCKEEIFKAFLPLRYEPWADEYVHRLQGNNSVAIHVRRGDYLHEHHLDKHPVCSVGYYTMAIYQFPATSKFIIFSDDIDWCKSVFVGDEYTFNTTKEPLKALLEMAECRHFIIANSTFSWWASWLGCGQTIIAPKKWFGPGNDHLSTKDIYPEDRYPRQIIKL